MKPKINNRSGDTALDRTISLWCLRGLVELDLWQHHVGGRLDEDLRRQLRIPKELEWKDLPKEACRSHFHRALVKAEKRPVRRTGELFRNLAALGDALGLSEVERELLCFAVALEISVPLYELLEHVQVWSTPQVASTVARLLHLPAREVIGALGPDGTLLRGRLVLLSEPEKHRDPPLRPAEGLTRLLLTRHGDTSALLHHFFRPQRPPTCGVGDFAHVAEDVDALGRLLGAALDRREKGVNVLLHGRPGTGKSELVRVLSSRVNARLYEVADQGADGTALPPARRFGAYLLCQRVVGMRERALVLFDEVEDVFPDPLGAARDGAVGKAWVNRLLEENVVPALWVCNDLSRMDPAYLRRFDYVFELRSPPAKSRSALLRRTFGEGALAEPVLRRLSSDDRLTPAHVARAGRLCELVGPRTPDERGALLTRVLDAALDLQGPARRTQLHDGTAYDLAYVNVAGTSLPRLVERLRSHPSATLCLSGAPGTGKTAFAHHLADSLGRPLHVQRASDLLGCYVGQTEANLAAMFRRASAEKAVLLLDEADGFLRDRANARQVWEVTQVNELLVQMESFDGLFLCATNAFDSLDPAALRRFSLKLRFDAPTAEQRWSLFGATLGALGLTAHERPTLRATLDALDGLTPGDFRTVLRQAPLWDGPVDAWTVAERLAEEWRQKPENRRASVGFSPRPVMREGGAAAAVPMVSRR